jgi:hypothetical protein
MTKLVKTFAAKLQKSPNRGGSPYVVWAGVGKIFSDARTGESAGKN